MSSMMKSLFTESPFHHLPNINNFEGLMDLLSLCCIAELGHVLCDWSFNTSQQRVRLGGSGRCKHGKTSPFSL
ncbi:hypothetical protein M378DRAFT_18440 [Amanita muscaria Koide BX008]|uniref:Uncharacterized protein n=1 Tax=Amanita muscaria (strain Koide BX008) TaxID=946122 RepID=A0A0C2RX61_AMAMK|nr:hypothetical protein M378DRAFT_18440 [Amanita muscaria Koide BX008]